MARILTPNVFITNNAEVAKSFFLKGTYINVEDLPDVPDALVISGKTNKYLQSMEYSVNFDNENNPSLTLEFVDTDGNFEQNMFMHLINSVKGSLQSVFRGDAARNGTPNISKGPTGGSLVISDDPSRVGVRESDLLSLYQYSNNYNRIFIAFGTDNILSNWSDLQTFYLNKTTIDVSNGLRKYIFKFFASNESIFRPKLKFNFEDPNYKREFLFLDAVDRLIVTIPRNDSVDTLENILYRLVKKYLSIITKTPEKNIIGIIPFLSDKPSIEDEYFIKAGVSRSSAVGGRLSNLSNLRQLGIQAVNEANQFDLVTQRLRNPAGLSTNPAAMDAVAESNSNASGLDSYMLLCSKEDSSVNPGFPDFYDALNKINTGIKSILGTVDDFVIFQENNVKILEFWKSKNLIADTSGVEKAVVFGPQQMISEYLYRNYIPDGVGAATTFESYLSLLTNSFTPSLPIYDETDTLYSRDNTQNTNVAKILLNSTYGPDIVSLVSKRKISSNFYEEINIDELSIQNDKLSSSFTDLFKTRGGLFELFDIPIFLNNFTNANILNIQFINSEIYLNGLKLAIDSNFSKAYLALMAREANKATIAGLSLKSVFDSYKKILISTGLDKDLIKQALVQQFYLATEQDIEIKLDEIVPVGSGRGGIDLLKRVNLFSQLRNIKPKPIRNSLTRKKLAGPAGVGAPGIIVSLLENEEELKIRLSKQLGFKLLRQEDIEFILTELESIALGLDNLIYKYKGNINIDVLFLAIAAEKSDTNPKPSRNILSREGYDPKAGRSYIFQNIDLVGLEIDKQEKYFNLANTLFSIFDIKTLDDWGELREGVIFQPKQIGLSQENIASELWNHMNRQAIKLSVKTLPFFHLSSFRLVNFKPCFVFSKQVTPININSTDNSAKLDFFSGIYNIAAFKHVISTRECYSQFMLVKNIGNAYLF